MNQIPKNRNLTENAKKLRKEMTREEKHLWYDFLSRFPESVRRQCIIGDYIVDFACMKRMLIIEVDGVQHTSPEMKEADARRDLYLKELGFTVLRFPNRVIWDYFSNVCYDILSAAGYTFDDMRPSRKKRKTASAGN